MKAIVSAICKINDSRQKIALGFGLGVLSGIFPGTGPLVAIFLSFLLRANYVSALLGSLLTNTWLSIVTFLLAIKVGAAIMGVNWQDAQREWSIFLSHFQWTSLIKISVLRLVLPVFMGYLVIAFLAGVISYLIVLVILGFKRRKKTLILPILILIGFPILLLTFVLTGCSTTGTVGTTRSAKSSWAEGTVTQDIDASLSQVIQAATLSLRALELNITKTDIKEDVALIIGEYVDNQTIWIDLRSTSELSTHLAIRVSLQGNREASYRILEKMREFL